MQYQECHIDLTESVEYDFTINKDRNLDVEIIAEIYSGDTYVTTFEFSPYSAATLMVKQKQQDNYSILRFDTQDGSIVLDNTGVFKLVKTAYDLSRVKAGIFYYDMYLSGSPGVKRAFLHGKFTINQNVSI